MVELVKETREEIAKYLGRYDADSVRQLFFVFSKIISTNEDFRMVALKGESESLDIIENEMGVRPECSLFEELSEDAILILREIMEIEISDKKVTKKKAVDLMSRVLSDDILFEGACLSVFFEDFIAAEIFDSFGCPNRFSILCQDEVFKKRREYMRLICDYALAAVNLYGVVHIGELRGIINEYENWPCSGKSYIRETGTYRKSVFYTPEYYCTYTVHRVIGDDIPSIETTMSGYILNNVFRGSSEAEIAGLSSYVKKNGINRELTEDDLEDYFTNCEPLPYMRLHTLALEKDKYIPSKREFLKFADEHFIEETTESNRLADYILKHFRAEIHAKAVENDVSDEEEVDDFVYEIQEISMDRNEDFDDRSPTEMIQFAFNCLEEEYGVVLDDTDQANELLMLLSGVANSSRLWVNNGHTPNELMALKPMPQGPMTIVPGSSQARDMLEEAAPHIRKMGMNVDLDANATEIPGYLYENGLDGPVVKTTRKVYPNDPCPCGSGKKYKKCCGKNK